MSGKVIAEQIAPHLPYLRRFARALCGTQDGGDAYVVQMLEAIIADNAIYKSALPSKIATFRAFLDVWSRVPSNTKPTGDVAGRTAPIQRRLEAITPRPRQAFMLMALEGLGAKEIASIMGTSDTEAAALVDQASREIAEQIAARVMIIEDEPLIALDIETLVTDIGHTPVGIAATAAEAIALARKEKPDIILSDIQLADGSSGIDAVKDILSAMSVPVIFITAYPERLLTGTRPEPTYLITKPFQPAMVKALVSQALFFESQAKAQAA
jgi:CheY-like chemotaxis protein